MCETKSNECKFGFWKGFWHGIITPYKLIFKLFRPKTTIFDATNKPFTYKFGIFVGLLFSFNVLHTNNSQSNVTNNNDNSSKKNNEGN